MIDLTGNNELNALCADWLEAKKKLKEYKDIEADAKLKIVNALNKNQTDEIIVGCYEVTRQERKGSEGKPITLDDVGKITGARKASTSILINEIER